MRARMIRPEFWTDSKVTELSIAARLLFIGTWNIADDYGYFDDDPKQLRLRIFPGDPNTDCAGLLKELLDQRVVTRYIEPDTGTTVLRVTNFGVHQKVSHKGKSRWSEADLVPDIPEGSGGLRRIPESSGQRSKEVNELNQRSAAALKKRPTAKAALDAAKRKGTR